ncbi:MAG: alpha/beta hydrolase [Buchananella hordeovulneris]|nr:alpha/beta hydrolase [Buchananella hordeovulneris]
MNAKRSQLLLILAVIAALLGTSAIGVSAYKLYKALPGRPPANPSASATLNPDNSSDSGQGAAGPFSANERPEQMPAAPAGLDKFYGQSVEWGKCEDGSGGNWACGTVTVPLDYDKPEGKTIEIALKRHKSEDPRGTLFVNFGGPGGSGTHNIGPSLEYSFTAELVETFDIVGFDPRGVHLSAPIKCRTFEQIDEDNAATTPFKRGKEAWDEVAKSGKEFADLCLANTDRALLENVDTVSVASDLDILRDAVNDSELHYLGYSYGTHLGARYAEMFPKNVGRMVLDAAVDPALTSSELAAGQAVGFENTIREFVRQCQEEKGCPFTGNVDNGMKQLSQFFEKATANPIPTSDKNRPLTGSLAVSGVLGSMYTTEVWDMLEEGLAQAMEENDGSQLLNLIDLLNERGPDGSYPTNSDDAFPVISAMDYPVKTMDTSEWEKQADAILAAAPTVGKFFLYSDANRASWPLEATCKIGPVKAAGAKPIVVVGGKGDPATPYEWSVSLAGQLESGILVTYEGWGHGAYGGNSVCVDDAVDNYFINGELPMKNKVCE